MSSPVPRVILLFLLALAAPPPGTGLGGGEYRWPWRWIRRTTSGRRGAPGRRPFCWRRCSGGRGDTTPGGSGADGPGPRRLGGGGGKSTGRRGPLLQGRPWLTGWQAAKGWRVLAATLEAEEEWERAAEAWEQALPATSPREVPEVALRRIRALIRAGGGGVALAALEALPAGARAPGVTEWVATGAGPGGVPPRGTPPPSTAPSSPSGWTGHPEQGPPPPGGSPAGSRGHRRGPPHCSGPWGPNSDLTASRRSDALSRLGGSWPWPAGTTATARPPLRTALSLADQGSGA